MTNPEIFYLTTAGEYSLLSRPRACRVLRRLRDDRRDDYMLVEITPALIGQSFGLGAQDVTKLILSTRHQGHTLFPIDEWPVYVYVARPVEEKVIEAGVFGREQVQLIAWGMLFQNYEDAEKEALQYSKQLL